MFAHPMILERDKDDTTLRHALGPISECGDRMLRGIYNETVKPWSVVTALFDRKAGRIL